jgi:hypothetical protein
MAGTSVKGRLTSVLTGKVTMRGRQLWPPRWGHRNPTSRSCRFQFCSMSRRLIQ